MARITVLVLLIIYGALAAWHELLWQRGQALEQAWSRNLQVKAASQVEILRKTLIASGCKLSRETGVAAQTKISFQGLPETYVNIVNVLLKQPFTWSRWSGDMQGSAMHGTILLSKL